MSTLIQTSLFDFEASTAAADRGMQQALPPEEDRWRLEFERAVCQLAASGREFISDDVRAIVGDPPAWVHPNAAGSLFGRMAKLGVIRAVGLGYSARVCGHRNRVLRWRGVGV